MKRMLFTTALAVGALAFAGCASSPGPTDSGGSDAPDAGGLSIGFFGFAAANSFAQGTFSGVEAAANEAGATATFVDGNFDGQQQVQQVNDAVTSKQYDIIIIQANDNLALQDPLQKAVDAGITVVVEFTPVGPAFDTIDPQVTGAISLVDPPVQNGEALGTLGVEACAEVGDGCQVAYMEGFRSLPLDNARTEAVVTTLEAGGVEVLPTVEGGYTQDEGRTAYQNIVQANPDVDVIIGSSQAIAGAALAAGADSGIKFIGNGGSKTAVDAVISGAWFATYVTDVYANGAKAVELGMAQAQGEDVETAIAESSLAPNDGIGTKEALESGPFVPKYDD